MNPYQLIDYLNSQKIYLSINENNGKLVIKAPSGTITEKLFETIEANKSGVMEIIDVKNFLGDDLNLYANQNEAIKCWIEFLQERCLIESGQVPSDYTAIAHCNLCGDIYVPPEIAAYGNLQGCMWCSNRFKKIPIPRPTVNTVISINCVLPVNSQD